MSEQGVYDARDEKLAPAYEAQGTAQHAEYVANDPRGAATIEAEGRASTAVDEHVPDSARDAQYKANEARSTAADPTGTAEARARAEADERESEQLSKAGVNVNVTGSVSGSSDPEKK